MTSIYLYRAQALASFVCGFWPSKNVIKKVFWTFQIGTLKDQIVSDRFTETTLREKRADLQKEAAELTSILKQNQDITHTLTNVCQR